MSRLSRVWRTSAAVCIGAFLWGKASAAEFTLDGVVENATGAFATLVPPGTAVGGPVVFDDAAIAAGLAGPTDITEIDVNVGGFCFSTRGDTSGCPLGGTLVPITSIDAASVLFTGNFPSGGTFAVTAFSPSFGIFIPIDFDLDTGTFFADGGGLGTADGPIAFLLPAAAAAPNPAAFPDTGIGATESLDVTVTNTGLGGLAILGVAGNDPLALPFAIVNDGCSGQTVPPAGGTCVLQLQFAPTAGGMFADSFDIVSTDPANTPLTVNVSGTAVSPEIEVTPNPAAIPDAGIGMMSTADITVTNNGQADLTDIVVEDMDMLAAPFSILSDGCSGMTLGNAQSCIVQVQFAPMAGGTFNDSFDIASNDTANPSVTVDVSATALVPGIAVMPSPLGFTATTVGDSRLRTVSVTNNGGAQLDIGQITDPADLQQFVVSNDLCSNTNLGPSGACTFDVTFAPAAAGMFMTSLTIPSNADNNPAFQLNMTGTGVIAPVAEIELDNETLTFAEIEVGQSATQDIVVTSTGNIDLVIDMMALVPGGPDAVDFRQINDCPASLDPGSSCTITVTFEPLSGGDKTATLPINSNADLRPMIDVAISASAFLGSRIDVAPTDLTFGSASDPVELGEVVTASTTVSNSGNADLIIDSITFSASADAFMVQSQTCDGGVAPGESCTVTVQFAPVTDGDKMGTMTIGSNDADGDMPVVSLTGFVFTGARIEVPSLNVDVDEGGTVEVGMSNSVDIVIQSTGTRDLEITTVELGGNNPDQFSIDENCTAGLIASGSSCTIVATFAPTSAGAKSATVTVSSNDVTRRAPVTVITITGNAVEPPPPPPPPLSVPPAFTRSDVGGTGGVSLWLLTAGLGLLALRRRRFGQGVVMHARNLIAGGAVALAATVMLAASGPVYAISFENESGNINGSWDTTISYGVGYRLQAAADNLIGTANGGTKFSVNGDDGTLNFHRGIYSNALKVTSELELNYNPANLSLFVRGFYFYDYELEQGTRDRTPLSEEALDLAGSDGDLLDAFISWQFDVGQMPAEFRVGEQVVNWGESTFIQGGMNVINHINVAALRVPGAELREALLPQDLLFFSIGATPNLDFEVVYQYDWDDTEPDPVGTYFSTNDFAVDGGTAVRLGFGDTPDTPPPPFFTPEHAFNAIPRGDTRAPSDDGQWGWAARYFAPDFNNGTEFGFYYYNYHSRLPLISARTGSFEGLSLAGAIGLSDEPIALAAIDYLAANPGDTSGAIAAGVAAGPTVPAYVSQGIAATAISRGLPTALALAAAYSTDAFANTPSTGNDPFGSPAGETAEFFTVFPEDIQLYGFSWNTTLGQTAWQGEIAHHQNRPLQVDDLELLFAGLSSLRATFAQFGQLGSFSFVGGQANPDTPPLTEINGYFRRDYTQANMAFTRLFSRVFGADQAVALFEVAYHHVHDFPAKEVLRFDAAATVVSGNPALAELAHPGKPILPPDAFPDADSWGYRLAGRLDYSNVFGSFNMAPRFAWQHDVDGITPGPAGAFIEDRKAITIGNRFSYQNKWEFDISYSRFFGAGFQNEIHDRDFVAASVKFTF